MQDSYFHNKANDYFCCDLCLKFLTEDQVNVVEKPKPEINLIKNLNDSEYLLCLECYRDFNRKEK